MKRLIPTFLFMAAATSASLAQVGVWSDAGLVPRTPTIDVNTNYNNGNLDTGNLTITSNTNIFLAWEDDGPVSGGIDDFKAVWTLFDKDGNLLISPALVTNIVGSRCSSETNSITNWTYRAFFRSDGSLVPGYTGDFRGKAKANMHGDGIAWCAGCNNIDCEIPELAFLADGFGGNSPVVQLLNNDGTPNTSAGGPAVAGILSYSGAEVAPYGSVQPGDIEFLANGNFVIVGESRQTNDLALNPGQTAMNIVVYKVLTATGGVVMNYTNASSETGNQTMLHGVGTTSNGFAIRFNRSRQRIRLFDNNGVPKGPNILLNDLTCRPETRVSDRGDGMGFKGNGKDAYVWALNSTKGPWVTVINADGTVRYSRQVITNTPVDSAWLDADISEDGRVIVAWYSSNNDPANVSGYKLPQARLFDPCGRPIGPAFYLSERETGTNAVATDDVCNPRVGFRGNTIAAMWCSLNSPLSPSKTLAFRVFDAPPLAPCSPAPTITITQSGTDVIISWPASYGMLTLQSTPSLSPASWACVGTQPAIVPVGSENTMTIPIGPESQFLRMAQ